MTFVLAEPGAVIGAFVLYCVIGAVVGALLASAYWLWTRRPDMPQGFFRHRPSRATAAVIGGSALAGCALIGARAELWAFHRIDIAADRVTLHYALPARTRTLPRAEIERVALGLGSEKGATVRLVIDTRGGARHESAPTSRERYDAARAALGAE
jgi:hypothetical protein